MADKAYILIVDDNVSQCKTMAAILKRKGYEVITANDGPEALEKVGQNTFDIIFLDIKMPLMNGLETYRRIKQLHSGAIVVMMTAYAMEDLVQQALEEGAYGVIYKPLDIERVFHIIEEAKQVKKGALILVVDDDPESCFTLRDILAKRGYEVAIAHTGEAAVEMARQSSHDIFLIDMKLPTINGLETYLAIREINPEAVAVMVTAYRQETSELVDAALQNQAYACVYKPIDMDDLLGLVNEILERKPDET